MSLTLLGQKTLCSGIFFLQAGITTTLNSRCSVLAAANSVFGRWDDTKGEQVSFHFISQLTRIN